MGLRDLFRRKSRSDLTDPIGMANDDDYEEGEGGPSIYRQQLAEYRWAAQHEALNIARSGIDPTRWERAEMAFDFERGMAQGHENLRSSLANYVGARIRDDVGQLYEIAADIGQARDALKTADQDLADHAVEYLRDRQEIQDDDIERSRYLRLRSPVGKVVKFLIAALLILAEFLITGIVFESLFRSLPPGLGFVLALGVTVILVVIPHYAALGLKEGMTRHTLVEEGVIRRKRPPVSADTHWRVHAEEREDRGFRIIVAFVGVTLLLVILPLTILRTTGEGEFTWPFFFFLLFLQLVISGYFFLREWLDDGHLSQRLYKAEQTLNELRRRRDDALQWSSESTAEFFEVAEDLLFTISQAPRWDDMIISSFQETIRYFRHLLRIEHPEYEQFIYWAMIPYVGPREAAAKSDLLTSSIYEEHLTLDESGPMGREWWMRTAVEVLRADLDPKGDRTDSSAGGLTPGEGETTPEVDPQGSRRDGFGSNGSHPPTPDEDLDAPEADVAATDKGPILRDVKPAPDVEERTAHWITTKSPEDLLEMFLARYFDLPLKYVRRRELDWIVSDLPDEGDDLVDLDDAPAADRSTREDARRSVRSETDGTEEPVDSGSS